MLGSTPVLVVGIALVGIGSPIPILRAAFILRSRGVCTHDDRSDERKGSGCSKASSESRLRVHSVDLETSMRCATKSKMAMGFSQLHGPRHVEACFLGMVPSAVAYRPGDSLVGLDGITDGREVAVLDRAFLRRSRGKGPRLANLRGPFSASSRREHVSHMEHLPPARPERPPRL